MGHFESFGTEQISENQCKLNIKSNRSHLINDEDILLAVEGEAGVSGTGVVILPFGVFSFPCEEWAPLSLKQYLHLEALQSWGVN